MRTLALGLCALLLASCAGDDSAPVAEIRAFDTSRLTTDHQSDFASAVNDLSLRYPSSGLSIKEGSPSFAEYAGIIDEGASGRADGPRGDGSWVIQFDPWFIGRIDYEFLRVATHELCHVLGFDHDTGNPQGGHC